MALLLDTQIIIWLEENPKRISDSASKKIASEKGLIISAASIWELAIKLKTGKLSLNQALPLFIQNFQVGYGVKLYPITLNHIYETQELPLHHRDPFDRLLIAQALIEDIPVASSDAVWDLYGLNRVW